MGFSVVHGSPQDVWVPVDTTDTLYVGQIVCSKGAVYGVKPFGLAKGTGDTTDKKIPYGVIIGTNDKSPTYNSTYKGQSITGVLSQASLAARDHTGVEGVTPKGDPIAQVLVSIIDPCTVLRGPIYNASYGTAPTVQTITTAQADGMITAETWSAADAASFVAGESTIYMRSGANKGSYRIGNNVSQTAPDVTHAMPGDNTTSDTGLQIPFRPYGTGLVQFDSESTFLDVSTVYTTNYAVVEIMNLDLSVAGKEFMDFRFGIDHFAALRA